VYWDKGRSALTKEQYEALAEDKRATYKAIELDEEYYFYTRFGSPLAYARPLDIIAKSFGCKDMCLIKKKILDFGYGSIGHLRLLANNGARVTGVDVDPILAALYSKPGDTGSIAGVGVSENKPPAGTLTLITGQWPADPATVSKVGDGYDLIISKNVLKNGYIHPEKEVPKGMLIDLGVDDAAFLKAVANTLNPDGFFLIYNICPAQKPDKYIPWADGRCPFTKEAIAAAGLEALEYNVDDSGEARLLGKALKWDEGDSPMDLTRDCFAWYTLIHKPVVK
jgi:SAM-dependent methyltransferase